MKTFQITFILISLLFSSFRSFSQSEEFKCDMDEYQGRHGDNQKWNDLIDNACKEIKKHNYEKALDFLTEANNIEQDAYIYGQAGNLKKFIENNKGSLGSKEDAPAEQAEKENLLTENTEENKPGEKNAGTQEVPKQNNPEVQAQNNNPENTESKTTPADTAPANPDNPSISGENEKNTEKPQDATKTDDKTEDVTPAVNDPSPVVPETKKPDPIPVPVTSESPATAKPDETSEKTFSEEEMKEFQDKGMQKVRALEDFMLTIGDKNTSSSLADQSIENAMRLFDSEYHFVEVSSVNTGGTNKHKTRKYFEKLRMLNYDNVNVQWAEFQYTSDFVKGPDGNYHGYIKFVQRFTGIRDNVPVYSDKTTKTAEVILKPYTKGIEGIDSEQWDVFLGDISVIYTEKK